jgi:hypothetical protein
MEADILIPLALIYAYVGRFADARHAIVRAWSVHDRSGAKSRWALGTGLAGHIEQIAGDPPAAGHHLQEAHKALRTIGEQGFLARTEVDRLAGTPKQAQASLRAALRTATDRHATRSPTRPQPPSTAWPAIRRSANTRTAATGVPLGRGT